MSDKNTINVIFGMCIMVSCALNTTVESHSDKNLKLANIINLNYVFWKYFMTDVYLLCYTKIILKFFSNFYH